MEREPRRGGRGVETGANEGEERQRAGGKKEEDAKGGVGKEERERERGWERENAEGVKTGGKGWLCLAVKAPGGCARGRVPRGIRLEGSWLAYRALASRILISRTEPGEDRLATNLPMFGEKKARVGGLSRSGSRVLTLPACFAATSKRYSQPCQ